MEKKVWNKPKICQLMVKETQSGGRNYDNPDSDWFGANGDSRSFGS